MMSVSSTFEWIMIFHTFMIGILFVYKDCYQPIVMGKEICLRFNFLSFFGGSRWNKLYYMVCKKSRKFKPKHYLPCLNIFKISNKDVLEYSASSFLKLPTEDISATSIKSPFLLINLTRGATVYFPSLKHVFTG